MWGAAAVVPRLAGDGVAPVALALVASELRYACGAVAGGIEQPEPAEPLVQTLWWSASTACLCRVEPGQVGLCCCLADFGVCLAARIDERLDGLPACFAEPARPGLVPAPATLLGGRTRSPRQQQRSEVVEEHPLGVRRLLTATQRPSQASQDAAGHLA